MVTNSFDELFYICRLHMLSEVVLQISPYVFSYVEVLQMRKKNIWCITYLCAILYDITHEMGLCMCWVNIVLQ